MLYNKAKVNYLWSWGWWICSPSVEFGGCSVLSDVSQRTVRFICLLQSNNRKQQSLSHRHFFSPPTESRAIRRRSMHHLRRLLVQGDGGGDKWNGVGGCSLSLTLCQSVPPWPPPQHPCTPPPQPPAVSNDSKLLFPHLLHLRCPPTRGFPLQPHTLPELAALARETGSDTLVWWNFHFLIYLFWRSSADGQLEGRRQQAHLSRERKSCGRKPWRWWEREWEISREAVGDNAWWMKRWRRERETNRLKRREFREWQWEGEAEVGREAGRQTERWVECNNVIKQLRNGGFPTLRRF